MSSQQAISAHPVGVAVHIEQCAKTFADGTRALKPTTASFAGGETVVLLGPSGCGKTTLLRIIAGLESPDAGGSLRFDDQAVTALPIEQRGVGMVFQSYALFPNMNVIENVAYGLKVGGMARRPRAERAAEMLDLCQIGPLAMRRIDQLSGGQRQRVALARAIAVQPRVLLLDEPLTALDTRLRVELREQIASLLTRLGITSVYVTHDQDEAMALADRIVVMRDGEIEQIGTPEEIYQQPANLFVANFVGSVNQLHGEIRLNTFHCDAGSIELTTVQLASLKSPTEGSCSLTFRAGAVSLTDLSASRLTGQVVATSFQGASRQITIQVGSARLRTSLPASRSVKVNETVGIDIDLDAVFTFNRGTERC